MFALPQSFEFFSAADLVNILLTGDSPLLEACVDTSLPLRDVPASSIYQVMFMYVFGVCWVVSLVCFGPVLLRPLANLLIYSGSTRFPDGKCLKTCHDIETGLHGRNVEDLAPTTTFENMKFPP